MTLYDLVPRAQTTCVLAENQFSWHCHAEPSRRTTRDWRWEERLPEKLLWTLFEFTALFSFSNQQFTRIHWNQELIRFRSWSMKLFLRDGPRGSELWRKEWKYFLRLCWRFFIPLNISNSIGRLFEHCCHFGYAIFVFLTIYLQMLAKSVSFLKRKWNSYVLIISPTHSHLFRALDLQQLFASFGFPVRKFPFFIANRTCKWVWFPISSVKTSRRYYFSSRITTIDIFLGSIPADNIHRFMFFSRKLPNFFVIEKRLGISSLFNFK